MARPLVLAHRGASLRAPENTVEAFELARELGADGVELDVRRTADDVLVVHHDPALEGLGLLAEHTMAELREVAPAVPTLDEAFDALEGMTVNVEVKCLPWEHDADPEHRVVAAVATTIRARRFGPHTIVSSFDLEAVNALRALDPGLATAWLTMGQDPLAALGVVADLGHAWLHPDVGSMLDGVGKVVKRAADLGVRLDVWTVDDPDEIARLAAAGVDAVITNRPEVAVAALG